MSQSGRQRWQLYRFDDDRSLVAKEYILLSQSESEVSFKSAVQAAGETVDEATIVKIKPAKKGGNKETAVHPGAKLRDEKGAYRWGTRIGSLPRKQSDRNPADSPCEFRIPTGQMDSPVSRSRIPPVLFCYVVEPVAI